MKSILITGAYGGMGSAAVTAFLSLGFRVFALDRRIGEKDAKNEKIIPIEADITSEDGVRAAILRIRSYTERLDAIIHFAGIYMLDSLVEMEPAEFRRIFDVNLYGVYLINKECLPLLSPGGRILITTSELAPLDP